MKAPIHEILLVSCKNMAPITHSPFVINLSFRFVSRTSDRGLIAKDGNTTVMACHCAQNYYTNNLIQTEILGVFQFE